MDNVDVPMFEDPALKAALRRQYSCDECCPARLRSRLVQAFRDHAAPLPFPAPELKPTQQKTWWRSYGSRLAIAASMLVTIGTVSLVLTHSAHALPANLQAAACSRHDSCSLHAEHQNPTIPTKFDGMGRYLSGQLNHPVLAANFTKDWTFRGVAICPLNGVPSAHLLYDNGDRSLSVFSLPASSFPSLEDHKTYEGTANGHSVVATRDGRAVYCLVCRDVNGNTDVASLRAMLAAHQAEAVNAPIAMNPAHSARLALAVGRED